MIDYQTYCQIRHLLTEKKLGLRQITITAGRETSVFLHGPQKHCLDPIACRSEWPQGASPEAEADAAVPCPTPQQSAQQKKCSSHGSCLRFWVLWEDTGVVPREAGDMNYGRTLNCAHGLNRRWRFRFCHSRRRQDGSLAGEGRQGLIRMLPNCDCKRLTRVSGGVSKPASSR